MCFIIMALIDGHSYFLTQFLIYILQEMNAKGYKEKERAYMTLFQMISQPKNSEYWREECSNQYHDIRDQG